MDGPNNRLNGSTNTTKIVSRAFDLRNDALEQSFVKGLARYTNTTQNSLEKIINNK